MTPPRFQTDFDDSDALRNPLANRNPNINAGKQRTPNSQGPFSALDNTLISGKTRKDMVQEFSILEILSQRQALGLRQIEAEKHFSQANYVKAFEVSKKILDEDAYFTQIVPLYCAVLTELKKVGELYYLAHKLVTANPDSAIAWFCVVSSLKVDQLRVHTTF